MVCFVQNSNKFFSILLPRSFRAAIRLRHAPRRRLFISHLRKLVRIPPFFPPFPRFSFGSPGRAFLPSPSCPLPSEGSSSAGPARGTAGQGHPELPGDKEPPPAARSPRDAAEPRLQQRGSRRCFIFFFVVAFFFPFFLPTWPTFFFFFF